MSERWRYAAIAVAALVAGSTFWWLDRRGSTAMLDAPSIAPAALYSATFRDAAQLPQPLGRFQGQVLVLNFWATWCAPCREEMPAFDRVSERWAGRGVHFLGLSAEPPELAARFGRQLGVRYDLWTGGDEVGELSRRLGNRARVLPHTALIGPDGRVIAAKVGPYSERELEALLQQTVAKYPDLRRNESANAR